VGGDIVTVFTEGSATERKENKEKRRQLEIKQAARDKAVLSLYQTPEGRDYLWWLLEITQAYGHNPYRGSDRDTAFACGVQNVGQQLLAHMMTVSPAAFTKLLLERSDESKNPSVLNAGMGRRASTGGDPARTDTWEFGSGTDPDSEPVDDEPGEYR
jgi:hypothetical protein